MTDDEYKVSIWGDENALKFHMVMVSQLRAYT